MKASTEQNHSAVVPRGLDREGKQEPVRSWHAEFQGAAKGILRTQPGSPEHFPTGLLSLLDAELSHRDRKSSVSWAFLLLFVMF